MPAEAYIPNQFRRSIQMLAVTVTALAVEGLVAWLCGWQSPFAIEGSRLPMAPGTAAGFTLLGGAVLAFVSLELRRLWIIRLIAVVVLMLSTFRFTEYLTASSWKATIGLAASGRQFFGLAPAGPM